MMQFRNYISLKSQSVIASRHETQTNKIEEKTAEIFLHNQEITGCVCATFSDNKRYKMIIIKNRTDWVIKNAIRSATKPIKFWY